MHKRMHAGKRKYTCMHGSSALRAHAPCIVMYLIYSMHGEIYMHHERYTDVLTSSPCTVKYTRIFCARGTRTQMYTTLCPTHSALRARAHPDPSIMHIPNTSNTSHLDESTPFFFFSTPAPPVSTPGPTAPPKPASTTPGTDSCRMMSIRKTNPCYPTPHPRAHPAAPPAPTTSPPRPAPETRLRLPHSPGARRRYCARPHRRAALWLVQ